MLNFDGAGCLMEEGNILSKKANKGLRELFERTDNE